MIRAYYENHGSFPDHKAGPSYKPLTTWGGGILGGGVVAWLAKQLKSHSFTWSRNLQRTSWWFLSHLPKKFKNGCIFHKKRAIFLKIEIEWNWNHQLEVDYGWFLGKLN